MFIWDDLNHLLQEVILEKTNVFLVKGQVMLTSLSLQR